MLKAHGNTKRNKAKKDGDCEQFCSPVKRRKLQQKQLNISKDNSSESDDSGSEEILRSKDNIRYHKVTENVNKKPVSVNDRLETESDSDDEFDMNITEKEVQQAEKEDLEDSSVCDDDSDEDDSENEEESNDDVEIQNISKLKTLSSKDGLDKTKSVSVKHSNTDDDDSDDDSDDENGDDVMNLDIQTELKRSSKARDTDTNKDDSESSSSDDDDENDDSSENDDVLGENTKNELASGRKTDINLISKTNSKPIDNQNKKKGQTIPGKDFTSEDSDSSDEGNVIDDDKPDVQNDNQSSDEDNNLIDDSDDDGRQSGGGEETADQVEDEFDALKKELANVPLEDLMKIKEKLGLKMFNKVMHGDKFEDKKQRVFKRANKNRPMEMSAKKRVPVIRHAEVAKEKVRRDPRFDDLSGEFQDRHFMKNYSFLDDIKSKEKLLVEKKMKKTKDENKKKELEKLLNRMNQQEQSEKQKRRKLELEQQWKEKEKQLVKEGKTPYFLKKSERKKLELAEKFKELQKSGKVDQYMSKKLKKNAKKEKKKLPGRHQRFM